MAVFSGIYIAKVDKGRCFFPAQFRKELGDGNIAHLKVRITENDKQYLEIYEENDWKARVENFKRVIKYEDFDYEKEDYLAEFTSNVENVDIELKSETNSPNVGRMVIPKKMTDDVHIKNEVVFVGTNGVIRVWSKECYDKRPTKNLKAFIEEQRKNTIQ